MNPSEFALRLRFWGKVVVGLGCWEWAGAKSSDGYGHMRVGKKLHGAHRLAYEFAVGPIARGLCVCHSCDNPACCYPAHLFLGTVADNAADRNKKGRAKGGHNLGEQNASARLTASQVAEIRRLHSSGVAQRDIARGFGVHFGTINDAVLRKTWRHVA